MQNNRSILSIFLRKRSAELEKAITNSVFLSIILIIVLNMLLSYLILKNCIKIIKRI